ncbi:copper-translocating P-type ATPase [Candidatus Falkowbacteria bacterium RBG_13_39_14]|uniref:Copper-translocating P-type ATPase n=1 Tax=Candidatus Falkowbacteria bacterium RBG_13_39_14 TaxID=1797985 RepID=A0A1F5S583_9BACT|nr:MAG: copper-translocating P-type ATPase [Candidatus Falkowbacteria bacterium RBG_13_39_14]
MNHKNHNQHNPHSDMNMKMDHSAHENHSEHQGYNPAGKQASSGTGKHTGHSTEMFKKRFYISLLLTVPVLALSPLIQHFLNFSLTFAGDKYLLFLISSVVFFYGGWPFLDGAKNEIKSKTIGMMTLISLAISVAYFYSFAVVFGLAGEIFFWELATLIDIMLLGHWIEMKSVMGASMALEKLSALIPDKAHLLRGKDAIEINTGELKDGDIILVKPGEKIPTDGIVADGESFVNESMLTGESKPVSKAKGGKVIGGSINEDGSLQIEVRGVGSNSYLSKVINLVKQAQASKSKTQALADKAAFWLAIVAILAGVITFFSWFFIGGNIAFAIERAATVLVIACPHALGLAIPLVAAISTTLSAQNGLLIRNRTAFENARKISTIVFDKTGTLTKGSFGVKDIFSFNNEYAENEILRLFAGLDKNSEHPIAKAIVKTAKDKNVFLPEVDKFRAIKGKGAEGIIEGKKISVASPGYVKEFGLNIPENLKDTEGTIVFLVISVQGKNILAGAINLTDTVREESFEAIKILKREGIKTWMLTGDNENSAKSVSDAIGLDGYFAGVLPDQKQEKIKELQSKGEFVAMVGDGINDAPALAQANVGIAIGSGTDVAAETADIILINSNPKDISSLILFGKATYRKMIQNLAWATGYNVFAIPLAAGALAGYGILLSLAAGAVLMSLSTIAVAINAKLLKVKRN